MVASVNKSGCFPKYFKSAVSQHRAIKTVGQLEISLIMCIEVSVLMIHYVDLFARSLPTCFGRRTSTNVIICETLNGRKVQFSLNYA